MLRNFTFYKRNCCNLTYITFPCRTILGASRRTTETKSPIGFEVSGLMKGKRPQSQKMWRPGGPGSKENQLLWARGERDAPVLASCGLSGGRALGGWGGDLRRWRVWWMGQRESLFTWRCYIINIYTGLPFPCSLFLFWHTGKKFQRPKKSKGKRKKVNRRRHTKEVMAFLLSQFGLIYQRKTRKVSWQCNLLTQQIHPLFSPIKEGLIYQCL